MPLISTSFFKAKLINYCSRIWYWHIASKSSDLKKKVSKYASKQTSTFGHFILIYEILVLKNYII